MNQRIIFSGIFRTSIILSSLTICSTAFAHAQLLVEGATPPRYDTSSLKNIAPCGNESSFASVKTNRVSIFTSGETINVTWKETVNHSGSFFLDFSTTGINGIYSGTITIPDNAGTTTPWNMDYTFPSTTCTNCMLRLRQDMGNVDISGHYFSCADVILVSGDDVTPPSNTTNVMTTVTETDVDVSWTNPGDADYNNTIVVRSQAGLNSSPQIRQDYLVSDQIGNGEVVYKGTATQFTDTGLAETTTYTYTVYSYDNDYNYNTGAVTTATTDQAATPAPVPPTPTPTPTPTATENDSGSGSLTLWLLVPLLVLSRRRWYLLR